MKKTSKEIQQVITTKPSKLPINSTLEAEIAGNKLKADGFIGWGILICATICVVFYIKYKFGAKRNK